MTSNLLPWQGQLMVPSATFWTVHPWCVQTAENAWKVPCSGCVTTTRCSANMVPAPTGTSAVEPSAVLGAGPLGCLLPLQPDIAAVAAIKHAPESAVRRLSVVSGSWSCPPSPGRAP